MKNRRTFHKFTYKDSNFRLCCRDVLRMKNEIIRQRTILEEYIVRQPEFKTSLVPLSPLKEAPEIAVHMCRAAMDVGVGPMAAVAGAIAQCVAETAVNEGDEDVIVENGGDIFMVVSNPLSIGIHAGPKSPFNGLAFRVVKGGLVDAVAGEHHPVVGQLIVDDGPLLVDSHGAFAVVAEIQRKGPAEEALQAYTGHMRDILKKTGLLK